VQSGTDFPTFRRNVVKLLQYTASDLIGYYSSYTWP
jgi:hypothetical protein